MHYDGALTRSYARGKTCNFHIDKLKSPTMTLNAERNPRNKPTNYASVKRKIDTCNLHRATTATDIHYTLILGLVA